MRSTLANGLLDLIVKGTAYARPASYEIALLTKNPNGSYRELVDAAYVRPSVPLDAAEWQGPTAVERSNINLLRVPSIGSLAGPIVNIAAVAFYAPGSLEPDFVSLIPGGFDTLHGVVLFPPGTLRINLNLPAALEMA